MPNAMDVPSTLAQGDHPAAARSHVAPGRIGMYAALGASVGTLPLPWVPESLMRRVRGALAQDLAARHGLSLTREARDVLCAPSTDRVPRGVLTQLTRYFGVRLGVRFLARFGPTWMIWPLQSGLRTFALGHLLKRYLGARPVQTGRIDVDEARRVRRAVDGAFARAVSVEVPPVEALTVIDDQRDASTAFVDDLLGFAAGIPDLLLHRLEAAFDELLATRHD